MKNRRREIRVPGEMGTAHPFGDLLVETRKVGYLALNFLVHGSLPCTDER